MQVRSAYAVEGRLLQTSARANMQPVPEDDDDAPLVCRVQGAGCRVLTCSLSPRTMTTRPWSEREFFIDNLLVRIHFVIRMISVDRPCAMAV